MGGLLAVIATALAPSYVGNGGVVAARAPAHRCGNCPSCVRKLARAADKHQRRQMARAAR